jgi:hypothetical protein
MKSGHRACYMSREFAQQHNFIPKDAAPGFYGFSGYVACRFASSAKCIALYSITNLGMWPIKVGEKTVQQQVMLVENAFFPVILGRCVPGSFYLEGFTSSPIAQIVHGEARRTNRLAGPDCGSVHGQSVSR